MYNLIKHCMKLVLDDNFKNDIINFRKKWYEYLESGNLDLIKPKPPVDFKNPNIEYVYPKDIPLFSDIYTGFWERKRRNEIFENYYNENEKIFNGTDQFKKYSNLVAKYKGIAGYKAVYKSNENKSINICVNENNTNNKLWNSFKDLLNKYNFHFLFSDIDIKNDFYTGLSSLDNDINIIKTKTHPLYNFISSCCVFKLDYFFGPNLEPNEDLSNVELLDPRNFLVHSIINIQSVIIYNNEFIQNQLNKLKLEKITKLLNDSNYNKKDIKKELNSDNFKNKKEKLKNKLMNLPPLILFPGVIQSKDDWDMIYYFLEELSVFETGIGKKEEKLIKAYNMYLDRLNSNKTYDDLGYIYGKRSTVEKYIKNFCKQLNIKKP